jgi:hypothetical protein
MVTVHEVGTFPHVSGFNSEPLLAAPAEEIFFLLSEAWGLMHLLGSISTLRVVRFNLMAGTSPLP